MTDHWINRRTLFSAAGVLGVTAVAPAAAARSRRRRPPRAGWPPRPGGTPTPTRHRPPTPTPTTDPSPTPPPVGTGTALIGMSAPVSVWDAKVAAVGAGLGARRIFADLASGASSQLRTVERAHADGMLPVISYKVGGDVAGAVAGSWNAVAEQAATQLASFGLPTAVTFWHEPNGDLTPADYVAASKQILPAFKRDALRVGPILNGWLLDNQLATFDAFSPDELFGLWDWFGIDAYEGGTAESPGRSAADRVYALSELRDVARLQPAFGRRRVQRLQCELGRQCRRSLVEHPQRVVRLCLERHGDP